MAERPSSALVILCAGEGEPLEVEVGYRTGDIDLGFSRTVVQKTLATGRPILCENAKDDPRFMEAESIKGSRRCR